jgi:hypothetical protein
MEPCGDRPHPEVVDSRVTYSLIDWFPVEWSVVLGLRGRRRRRGLGAFLVPLEMG